MADRTPERELALWNQWTDNKSPENLGMLLDFMNPVIQSNVNKFRAAPIPQSAINLEAKKWALKSFETYDPNKGRLSTHTTNWLKKINRYVYGRQNVGYIPEERVIKLRTFENVRSNLESKLGREPSQIEVADELRWPLAEVERMEKEIRKDIAPTDVMSDFGFIQSDPSKEILNYIYYELSPQEQIVYDYSIGSHGKPKRQGAQIAAKLGVSQSKVSQIRKEIGEKMERYRQ